MAKDAVKKMRSDLFETLLRRKLTRWEKTKVQMGIMFVMAAALHLSSFVQWGPAEYIYKVISGVGAGLLLLNVAVLVFRLLFVYAREMGS